MYRIVLMRKKGKEKLFLKLTKKSKDNTLWSFGVLCSILWSAALLQKCIWGWVKECVQMHYCSNWLFCFCLQYRSGQTLFSIQMLPDLGWCWEKHSGFPSQVDEVWSISRDAFTQEMGTILVKSKAYKPFHLYTLLPKQLGRKTWLEWSGCNSINLRCAMWTSFLLSFWVWD